MTNVTALVAHVLVQIPINVNPAIMEDFWKTESVLPHVKLALMEIQQIINVKPVMDLVIPVVETPTDNALHVKAILI